MPRKPPTDLDERLIEHVANNPSGTGVEELLRLLKGEVSRRTIQRRLSALVRAGRLISEGAGPLALLRRCSASSSETIDKRLVDYL